MKKFKLLFVLLLILTLSLALISCNEECEHKDEDGDNVCDECGEKLGGATVGDGEVLLIDGAEIKFQIVKGTDVDIATIKLIDDFIEDMKDDFGLDVLLVDDKASTAADCEVLIGSVTSRGDEYIFDKYSLGKEGYAIKPVGGKVIVTAGSSEMLKSAVKEFFEEKLGVTSSTTELKTVKLTDADAVIEIQDNYRIKEVTIGGESIDGYKIVVDYTINSKFKTPFSTAAKELQDFFYTMTGKYLEVVEASDFEGENAIFFRAVNKGEASAKGFRVRVDGKSLLIECAHYNKFAEAYSIYYNKQLSVARNELLELKKFDSEIDIARVKYSDFGAKGDGKTDDAQAIYDAHSFANDGGQTVYGETGKTYRINDVPNQIVIKTDVNWNGATIIIDNSNVLRAKSGVPEVVGVNTIGDFGLFLVEQDHADSNATPEQLAAVKALGGEDGIVLHGLESKGVHEAATNIGFALGYPAMLTLQNNSTKNYIRYGYTDSQGSAQTELVIVDANGNIDASTPILNDFTDVTNIIIHRIDTAPITIQNATVEELSSRVNLLGGYRSISRGIQIKRANVTLKNLTHIIKDEIHPNQPVMQDENGLSVVAEGYKYVGGKIVDKNGKTYTGDDIKPFTGHSYNGFVSAWRTHNTLIENVVFQGRVKYIEGTYDIDATYANKTVFKNCTQSNFFEEGSAKVPNLSLCWGVAGTNYCKNLEYWNCELTRYDAHSGVTNGKVIGGKLAVLRLIGGGNFTMEGVKLYARNTPFQLREDYGASFNGEIIIKDCEIIDAWGSGTFKSGLISLPAIYWDMGYKTFCPSITIDNLTLDTTLTEIPLITLDSYVEYKSNGHFPHRDIFASDISDPELAGSKFHYDTKNPDKWIKENITDEGARFNGCTYETKTTGNGITTVIVTDSINRYPYHKPDHIKVINNQNQPYKLTLYKCDYFSDDIVKADSANLKRVDLPS